MTHSTLIAAQLNETLRSLALTVEEAGYGEFRWRILESPYAGLPYESVCCSDARFDAYDTALATGYGELQRLIGPDLQYGPRAEESRTAPLVRLAASSPSNAVLNAGLLATRSLNGGAAMPGAVRA